MANSPSNSLPSDLRPTRVRWHIVGMLTLITALTYVDRLNLGIAGKFIQDEFALSNQAMGWILSAFVLGYALFQIPGGWTGDRFGPRGILALAIVWWSVFTAATALVPYLPLRFWFGLVPAFFIIRFLVGVGEAAAFPNENKIVAFWMGHSRRGIGNSMFLMGIGLGGTLTPRFIAWIMQRWGWRMSFYVCGGLGLVLALAWRLYATNRPEEHRRVNSAELALIRASRETAEAPVGLPPAEPPLNPRPSPAAVGSGQGLVKEGINHPVPLLGKEGTKGWSPQGSPAGSRRARPPWKAMLTSASAWGLMLSYFCEGYPNYIFYTWFFLYLVNVRHLTITQGSFWGAAPFLAILLLSPLGGWVSDRAAARFGRRRGRQYTVWLGMALSALLLTAGAHTQANTLAIILLACAAGFNLFATSTWWATCIDLTGNFSGSLSAMMNMWGNLAGALSPILTPYIATRFGWTRALDFAALITFLACLLWIMVNAEGNLEKQTPFSSGAQ